MYEARFDQDKVGHPRLKPSVVATTSWYLFGALEQQVLTPEEQRLFERLPDSVLQRVKVSAVFERMEKAVRFRARMRRLQRPDAQAGESAGEEPPLPPPKDSPG